MTIVRNFSAKSFFFSPIRIQYTKQTIIILCCAYHFRQNEYKWDYVCHTYITNVWPQKKKKKISIQSYCHKTFLLGLCVMTLKKSKRNKKKHIFSSLITTTMNVTLNVNGHTAAAAADTRKKWLCSYFECATSLQRWNVYHFMIRSTLSQMKWKVSHFVRCYVCVFFCVLFDNARLPVGQHTSINKFKVSIFSFSSFLLSFRARFKFVNFFSRLFLLKP